MVHLSNNFVLYCSATAVASLASKNANDSKYESPYSREAIFQAIENIATHNSLHFISNICCTCVDTCDDFSGLWSATMEENPWTETYRQASKSFITLVFCFSSSSFQILWRNIWHLCPYIWSRWEAGRYHGASCTCGKQGQHCVNDASSVFVY
jgi:hypothetical protein